MQAYGFICFFVLKSACLLEKAMRDPMAYAYTLAQSRLGFCSPNPSVGAVIINSDGQKVGEGVHWQAGQAHAEVVALEQAQDKAKDATLYVTLVPCHHHGKTPPCTDKIIAFGLAKVVYAYQDPHELVYTHKSESILKQAGIEVVFMPCPNINAMYEPYAFWCRTRRPWVDVKLVHSLEGSIAYGNKEPAALSGPLFNHWVHEERMHHDALLTTVNTVLSDDPRLNARLNQQEIAKPIFILDRRLRMPMDAKLWRTAESITIFYDPSQVQAPLHVKRLQDRGAQCLPVTCDDKQLSWAHVLDTIGEIGVHSLWVEAGQVATHSLINSNLWQRFILVEATKTSLQGYEGHIHNLHLWCEHAASRRSWQLGEDAITEWLQ